MTFILAECEFDGHDCCPLPKGDQYLGDGNCNAGFYFSKACGFDQGDCTELKKKFPLCPDLLVEPKYTYNGEPVVLGDGVCDFIQEYMTAECGYEFGDCVACQKIVGLDRNPDDLNKLGDGICDGGKLNTAECGWEVRTTIKFALHLKKLMSS